MAAPMSVNSLMAGLAGGGATPPPMPQVPNMAQALGGPSPGPQMPGMMPPVPALPPEGGAPFAGLQSALAAGKPVPSLDELIFGIKATTEGV
jgi:hypothetical protein